ncbi:MAG TPA: GldG family protein, partial [Acidobacteriota bacterium]|nr:GldG family protein [Acidobacteriota bacterium]
SLSSLTINTLKDLKTPVKITAFFTESSLPNEPDAAERRVRMQDLLDNYKIHSKNLDIRLIDPLKNKMLVDQYQINTNGTTILESGTQKANVTTVEEEDLTNAVLRVTSKKETVVYFLQGHGEPATTDMEVGGYSSIVDELKKINYNIKELKDFAAKPKVPEDCTVLVIINPRANFLDPEINGIKEYLAAGGRALILDDPQADASLANILNDYGVTRENDIVVDDQNYLPTTSAAVPLIVPKSGTSVTKEFNFAMFFPASRSLSYKEGEGNKVSYTAVAESAETSWGETDKQRAEFEEDKDKKGPLTVGLLVTKPVEGEKKRSEETRLAVFGDADFVRNAYVNIPGNGRILINSVAWLSEQENLIHLPPKNERSDVMMLSSSQLKWIAILMMLILPGAVLTTGISIWLRRKKL